MADLIDRTATGVRIDSRRREYVVHGLIAASTSDFGGRQYKTECHRYLYADEGAILTTQPVTCAPCNGTAVPQSERREVAGG